MALVAGQDAHLRCMPHAFFHRRSKNHADQAISGGRTHEERSFRQELSASRQNHDVAKEFHSARFGAVLIVDIAVNVIGVGKLNQFGARNRTRGRSTARCEKRAREAFRSASHLQDEAA